MSDFTNKLSAPELIAEIAMDPPETDPKKIQERTFSRSSTESSSQESEEGSE